MNDERVNPGHRLPLRLMLSFTPAAFERRFVEHHVAFYHRYAQASLVLGLVLVLGDFLVDHFAYPGVAANLLRLQMALPVLLVGLGYTLLPTARRHWQPALGGFIVAVALCLFWILLRIDAQGGAGLDSWVGILNFTFLQFYCFVVLGVQFRFALISGLAILAAFEAALWWQPAQSAREWAYWSYHVLTLFVLAAGIGWWREFVLRKEFSARSALDDAREAAERLARAKGDFLAAMSHEIRTPLNGVLGMNELLLASELTPSQRAWAQAVQTSGQHLMAVIDDVLDVSRIESGRMTLEAADFDLREVVDDALTMFEQAAQTKGLALSSHFTPEAQMPALCGDPLRLRQVVINLIGNAIKFTEQGRVHVHAEVGNGVDGRCPVRIVVEDSGIGIAPDAQARIFEQFTQADGSTTRRYGGTGLGLAICRQLVELMGGRIGVESAPGQGARFTVDLSLPLAPQGAATVGRTEAARHSPVGLPLLAGTVLLVEDQGVNQSVAIAMLRKLGLDCALVENGAQAVEHVRTRPVDLVLMDGQMPVMDGYEASRRIRALPAQRGTTLPIVALTASTTPAEIERCLAAGMNAVIAKPVTLVALHAALAPWLPAAGIEAAAAAEPAIDASAIHTLLELDEDGGPSLLHEVAGGFIATAANALGPLQAAVDAGDDAALGRIAHALKSGAANVGARALSGCYQEIERCARANRHAEAPALLARVRREQARAIEELQAILRRPAWPSP